MSKSPASLLMDFYVKLLEFDIATSHFRAEHQMLYGVVRDALAAELECDSETIQNIAERLASRS